MGFGVRVVSIQGIGVIVEDRETREMREWQWLERKKAWSFALSRKKPIRFVVKRGAK